MEKRNNVQKKFRYHLSSVPKNKQETFKPSLALQIQVTIFLFLLS